MHSSNEPALARTTGELCSPPTASTNPLKTDVASSAAAGPPGNSYGSAVRQETPTNISGTRGLRPAGEHGVTLGSTAASMLGEILGRGTSKSEENLRGRDRSRLLETAIIVRSERCLVAVLQPVYLERHLAAGL